MSKTSIHIVTGASQGIGRAVAIELASRGMRVIAVGRSQEKLDSLAAQCGERITIVRADLANDTGIEHVSSFIGPETEIASIIHSAGSLVPLEPYDAIDPNELVEHFRIHVATPIALFQSLHQRHTIQKMLFIDSYSSSTARFGWSAYSIIKSAAQMSAKCATQELSATTTIRVFPGAVRTQIVDAVLASKTETAKTFSRMLERGEVAEPAEVAIFIVNLLTNLSAEELQTHESFDYNNPDDHFAPGL